MFTFQVKTQYCAMRIVDLKIDGTKSNVVVFDRENEINNCKVYINGEKSI